MELLKVNGADREHDTFIDTENLAAVYYRELKTVHFIWKQRTLGDPYRKAFVDAAEFAKLNSTVAFLSDIRDQGIVGPEDRRWFETIALPSAIESGVKRVAIVFDGNVFKMYYINLILKHFSTKGVPMRFFKDLKSAQEWLINESEFLNVG